ncbi:hypothetical protein DC366_13140 [Pelagivirga sediminicola]|uniref:Uncharacterized protein n=1 Tax=Pelagivirga sediminicola TaxID=2170575 RepID=A0A2T7G5F9_9RHOB|nr:DUF6173 family protein [Pelagivirga sediminicola]PVA09626.1 hypothetical protein DC366_13140 [Pelagivirga sediminicola]
MSNEIQTTAELVEADALPRCHEVHISGRTRTSPAEHAPAALKAKPVDEKSAAKWAYERLALYIKNFEKTLDSEHEVAMGFVGGDTGVLKIEGMGYFDPDIVTFYGSDVKGIKTQLVQHVSQLSVLLRAVPKPQAQAEPERIGFQLVADLEKE